MQYEKYNELKTEIEIYFADIIKNKFKNHFQEENKFTIIPDIQSHRQIRKLLSNDGLILYGMNVNTDNFELLFNFKKYYCDIENFFYTRLFVTFENHGNYSVYLNEASFERSWDVHLEDQYNKSLQLSEEDFLKVISGTKNMHLFKLLGL